MFTMLLMMELFTRLSSVWATVWDHILTSYSGENATGDAKMDAYYPIVAVNVLTQ